MQFNTVCLILFYILSWFLSSDVTSSPQQKRARHEKWCIVCAVFCIKGKGATPHRGIGKCSSPFLRSLSQYVDRPLESVTHGQCDARPMITFPAAGHHCCLTGTRLYYLLNGGTYVNNLPRIATWQRSGPIRFEDLCSPVWHAIVTPPSHNA